MEILLYTITLQQEDFFNLLVWFLSFIVVFSLLGYLFKTKVLYLASIIFGLVLIIKSINYFIDSNVESQLKVYIDSDNLTIRIYRDNSELYRQVIKRSKLKNIYIKDMIVKDRGGLSPISGSTAHYKAIVYKDSDELITTRNMYDGKFISVKDLEVLYQKLKQINNFKL